MPSLPTSSTSSSPSAPPAKSDTTFLAIIITLSIIGGLLIVAIIIATLRFRRNKAPTATQQRDKRLERHRSRIMSLTHPASRITPFGSVEEGAPKFVHTPGKNMRIANRRPDGVWEFADPNTPFSPAGISDLNLSPSSSTPSFSKDGDDPSKEDHHLGELQLNLPKHYPPPPAYSNESN